MTGPVVAALEHLILQEDLEAQRQAAHAEDGRNCRHQQLDGLLGCLDAGVQDDSGHVLPALLLGLLRLNDLCQSSGSAACCCIPLQTLDRIGKRAQSPP